MDTFQYKANDGCQNSAAATVTIAVNSINDPPLGTDKTVTTLEDVPYTFLVSDFGFTDPNDNPANNFVSVKITTPGKGTLALNGTAVNAGDFVLTSDITAGLLVFSTAANENGTPYTRFTFQVTDDGGGSNLDLTARTMTINHRR